MAVILCIETGTDVCSVALTEDGRVCSLVESDGGRDHAGRLGGYVDELLREGGLRPGDLDAVAVGRGPGSYTGLRIGVSLVKGICFGLGIPLLSVGSLEALAHVAAEDHAAGLIPLDDWSAARLCPMIDARRMEVYAQLFDTRLEPLSPVMAEVVEAESFAEWREGGELLIFGDGAEKCLETLAAGRHGDRVRLFRTTPSARGMAGPAFRAFEAGRFEDTAYFEPFYLKDFMIKESAKKFF